MGPKVFTAFGKAWRTPTTLGLLRLVSRRVGFPGDRVNTEPKEPGDERVAVLGRPLDEATAASLARLIDSKKPDFVFFDTIFLAPIVPHLKAGSRTLVITHDAFHRRAESLRRADFQVLPDGLDKDWETARLEVFDVILAIQQDEARLFKTMVPDKPVITVGMPASIPSAHRSPVDGRCIFVGSDGPANVDGLRWFIDEIWPIVLERLPQSELHVFGRVCGHLGTTTRPNIVLKGFALSLDDAYREACLAVAPLRAGSGLKIKMLEYLSWGLPCVTTSAGAEGFPASDEPSFIVADTPEDFANAVVSLLSDPEAGSALGSRAATYSEQFSRARTYSELRLAL
jgi:hypothetical protein